MALSDDDKYRLIREATSATDELQYALDEVLAGDRESVESVLPTCGQLEAIAQELDGAIGQMLPRLVLDPKLNDYQRLQDITAYVAAFRAALILETNTLAYQETLSDETTYEFEDADLQQIQTLLNQIRDLVQASEDLSPDHKRRVLQRLESLQLELHREMTRLGRWMGGMWEVCFVVGQMSKDLAPAIDLAGKIIKVLGPVFGAAWVKENVDVDRLTDVIQKVLPGDVDEPKD